MQPLAPARELHRFLIASVLAVAFFISACDDQSDLVTPDVSVASVTVTPKTLSLVVGQSQQLVASVYDAAGNVLSGRAMTWTSSDSAIALVTGDGVVSARNYGNALVSVTVEGKSAGVLVSVSRPLSVATFASVTAGGAHTCALTSVGAPYCWGRGESGQLGVPAPTTTCTINNVPWPCRMTPIAVGDGFSFTQLAAGGAHTCGLTSDGTALCWGSNTFGQLGDGSTTNRSAPVGADAPVKFASISAGPEHTCALTKDGVAFCWGRNDRGQVGEAGVGRRTLPNRVATDLRFRAIGAGGFSIGQTCALTTSGAAAYCWGDNERGQLGRDTADTRPHSELAPVMGGLSFTSLSAGLGRHVCALASTGVAYCWGENTFGGLGNGSMFNNSRVPTRVSGATAFAQIVAGGFIGHSCGLTSAGVAWCWGENEVGAIGDGSTDDREVPVLVTGGLTFTGISAGLRHTCGITAAGAVYCWGSNNAAQLGINSTAQRSSPARVVSQP